MSASPTGWEPTAQRAERRSWRTRLIGIALCRTIDGRRRTSACGITRADTIAEANGGNRGTPAGPADQCEGCTWVTTQVGELSYLHSRDVTYATFCQGPCEESVRYRDFMGWDMPWYSAHDSLDILSPAARSA